MNVLFVSYAYPPFLETGGPPLKIRALAEGLVARGHRVTVLTSNHGRPSRRLDRHAGGVEVVYLREVIAYRFMPVTAGIARFCRERLREFRVVHIFGLYDPTGTLVARRLRRVGIPYVLEPMGMSRAIVRSVWKKRFYSAFLGRKLAGGAAFLIATSDQERMELVEDGKSESAIVLRRNGIDLRPFGRLPSRGGFRSAHEITDDEPVTMFMGRLALKKHPEYLLRAFASSAAPGRLVFIGPDEDGIRRRLSLEAEALRVGDRVIFTGPIYDERKKIQALVDADVFVLPSESENFGNAVVEAMACRTAVVVTDRCGVAPLVRDRTGLVVSSSAAGIQGAIKELWSNPALRQRLAAEGPAVASTLGWDEPLDDTERLYEKLLLEHAGTND